MEYPEMKLMLERDATGCKTVTVTVTYKGKQNCAEMKMSKYGHVKLQNDLY